MSTGKKKVDRNVDGKPLLTLTHQTLLHESGTCFSPSNALSTVSGPVLSHHADVWEILFA